MVLVTDSHINLSAQNPKTITTAIGNSKEQGLSDTELEVAKGLYVKMMKSSIYILNKKEIRRFNEKLNGAKVGPTEKELNVIIRGKHSGKTVDSLYRRGFEDNISRTKFKSVEEGMAALEYLKKLNQKKREENTELYALMRKANVDQIREILKPESDAMRAEMFN